MEIAAKKKIKHIRYRSIRIRLRKSKYSDALPRSTVLPYCYANGKMPKRERALLRKKYEFKRLRRHGSTKTSPAKI